MGWGGYECPNRPQRLSQFGALAPCHELINICQREIMLYSLLAGSSELKPGVFLCQNEPDCPSISSCVLGGGCSNERYVVI